MTSEKQKNLLDLSEMYLLYDGLKFRQTFER